MLHLTTCRLVLGAVVVLAGTVGAQVSRPPNPDPVDQLFEAYRSGRYDAVWMELGRTVDWSKLRDAINSYNFV